MPEKRNEEREICYAHILTEGNKNPGYLRDITSKGCRIELPFSVPWSKGTVLKVTFHPTEGVPIHPFVATIEIRWKEKADPYQAFGASIISLPEPKDTVNLQDLIGFYQEN